MPRRKTTPPTLAAAQDKLAAMGFTLSPLRDGMVLARKNGCAAVLGEDNRAVQIAVAPGLVVRGELARLVDRGYQKFFKTAVAEVPALPETLTAIAHFEAELRLACGIASLYNESLGSVSDRYLYDRIWYRDQGCQPKPWEEDAASALKA
ncbi:MAG: hypothetical protein ACRD1C_07790 [Terriglobales bacterium]